MQQSVEAPTPEALADLVARCAQINRYTTQLTAAEEIRISALAAGLLEMRGVLALPEIKPEKLPMRQRRIDHWALMASHLSEVATGRSEERRVGKEWRARGGAGDVEREKVR